MQEKKQQNYSNHARFDPAFHFFLLPVLLITLIAAIVHLVMVPFFWSAWLVVLSVALIVMAGKGGRGNALKAQDRVIRLEERMRLTTLMPEPLRARVWELQEGQLIALRFAPDAEAPELVDRTLRENLTPKQIKQAIQNWRADHFRI